LRNPDPHLGSGRALNIALRTAHLGAMAILCGGLAYGAPEASIGNATAATVGTGAALLMSEMRNGHGWLVQGCGLFAIGHVVAVAALTLAGRPLAGAVVALVVGSIGSHLPKALRKWSWRRGAERAGEER
jgi:hypothetical protein